MPTGPITVVIPTIPPRQGPGGMLERTLASVTAQTLQAAAIELEVDANREGGAATRNRALMRATTEWCAFFDDDDLMLPFHLEDLYNFALTEEADFVYSWFHLIDEHDQPIYARREPIGHFNKPFDIDNPHLTTIVTLVRRELAQGLKFRPGADGKALELGLSSEQIDWQFTVDVCRRGHEILGRRPVVKHYPQRTWLWRHWGRSTPENAGRGNTSGLPWSW